MRSLFFGLSFLMVMGLAYWAYSENYATQDELRLAASLQREIGAARETLSVLEAEWAYLNRPERLRDLADLNFETLGLLPISPDQFGAVYQVPYPPISFDLDDIISSTDVVGNIEGNPENDVQWEAME